VGTIRNLVTGGAGFLGSHLINKLISSGEEVYCIDNFLTGSINNLENLSNNPELKIINQDINRPIDIKVERIWHLACSASPKIYYKNPIETSKTNFIGTYNMLQLSKKYKAKLLLASSSEIYGDPEVHPQPESYKGSVNNIGIRACYVEGKRIAESLCFDFLRQYNCNICIARIFNTYGPRMSADDGRVISNFINQALYEMPLTIYGDGTQTRSFCYVDDLIDGLIALMSSNITGPINFGNPIEISILDLANIIRTKINPAIKFKKVILPKDDPRKRKPLIDLAMQELNWKPTTSLEIGLKKTIEYFKNQLVK